jgi:hypothetical protein
MHVAAPKSTAAQPIWGIEQVPRTSSSAGSQPQPAPGGPAENDLPPSLLGQDPRTVDYELAAAQPGEEHFLPVEGRDRGHVRPE